ncbi:hypothetical protein PPYR_05059 [Photinus pyralis]|uniref:Serpin domain-containing protein n=1 Tax=Photinus pyralis TaxID=7054 RepID=A0A5N4B001_PHOPY|nr:antichymotrypsin-2-like [Photinus pyralis]KAB0802873.1 hypothetical protein PPYR_05059 [Photinus pyralis]
MKIIILLSFCVLLTCGEQLTEYHEGNVQFTTNVYRELSKSRSGNILMCPLSVEITLAMVFLGATEETARQLSVAASFPNNFEKVEEMFSEVIPQLESSDKYTFESANKIYVQDKFKIAENYKDVVTNKFKSDIENIDFVNPTAAVVMNQWVAKKTHNKITKLINQDDLDSDSRLMLLNAMYFKGIWVNGFKESDTKVKPFFLNNTHYINTDIMSNKGQYRYQHDRKLNAKFLEMKYKGDDVVMVIALPDNPEDLHKLEDNLNQVLRTTFPHSARTVDVQIPKFEVKDTIPFKTILKSIGAVLPFQNGATFDRMKDATELEPLKIAQVIQKATIEVDEKGSVAAAATAVHMQIWRSARILDVNFYANHPFIYFIKHKVAGITFIGRYNAPEGPVHSGNYEPPIDPESARMVVL